MDDTISVWNYGVEDLKTFFRNYLKKKWGGDLKFTIEARRG